MIWFSRKLDRVFPLILKDALELFADQLRAIIQIQDSPLWGASYPTIARCFTPERALETVQQLLAVSKEPHYYRVTDYHWLLLYDCLRNYCELFNDGAREEPDGSLLAGEYRFREIDFEELVSFYFWDTDFLMPFEVAGGLGEKVRKEMGIADHVFGIAQGWEPHPEELHVERVDSAVGQDPGEDELCRPGSIRYPDPRVTE